ncbi:MAG: hypothetical protein AAF215_07260 [Cyanobacteria bacterium P01_A01_bin.123]
MVDTHVKLDPLTLGRGKRPRLNNQTIGMRMSAKTRQNLEKIAQSYDCLYGGKPWIAGLLEKIAAGQLIVVPAPPLLSDDLNAEAVNSKTPQSLNRINPKQGMKNRLKNKHYNSPMPSEGASPNSYEDDSANFDLSGYPS